jgi:hypothetical protein
MIKIHTDSERLNSVINWLIRAHEVVEKKGFSIGFDLRKGWLTHYSETTGYIIPTLYRYAIQYNDSSASEIATSAAHWLVSIQNEDGSMLDFVGHHKNSRKRQPVVFNTGQDLFGLLSAFRFTGYDIFIESAKKAAYWIISKQDKSGLWNDTASFGARHMASYYSHVTWPLYLIGKQLDDERIIEHANRGLAKILEQVNSNYSVKYWGFNANNTAPTHTIAYTIEGILEQSLLSDGIDSINIMVAKNIALKMIELQSKNKQLAGDYDEEWYGNYSYLCMPGNCQLAIIFMRLYSLFDENQFLLAVDQVLAPVIERQHLSRFAPSAIKGTVPASWPPVLGKYMRWLYPNWGAKYLADAIMFRMNVENESSLPDLENSYFNLLGKYPG